MNKLEKLILAHRYMYYIECDPILPDLEYDALERTARATLPEDSPVQKVGSDLASSYPKEIVDFAKELRFGK